MAKVSPRTLWGKELTDLQLDPRTFPTDEELEELDRLNGGSYHGWMKSNATGKLLHFRRFLPDNGKPKGIYVVLHGVHGHISQVYSVKEDDGTERFTGIGMINRTLTEAGFAVYGIDLVGHGFSEGPRFYVSDWKIDRDDCEQFCQFVVGEHPPDVPLFVNGISYGGALALHVGRVWQDEPERRPPSFRGLVLFCPAVVGDIPPLPVVWTLRYGLAPFFPTWTPFFMPHPVSPDRIWSDSRVIEQALRQRNIEMGLQAGGKAFSLGTASSLLSVTEEVRSKTIPGLTVPFCVVHGTKDYAVLIEGSEYLVEHCSTPEEDRRFIRIKDGYHDLLSEPSASETMHQVLEWMQSRSK